jgi:hypothetical protein
VLNRRKLALPIIVVFFAVLIYFGVTGGTNTQETLSQREFREVMALDFSDYPEQPDKVLEAYNMIDRFLSGNTPEDFTDEDLTVLIEKQRLLMASELLAQNPLEHHVRGYREKIENLRQESLRIISIRTETPIFSDGANTCQIAASQFWNKSFNISIIYNMVKTEDGDWKIVGWHTNTDESSE